MGMSKSQEHLIRERNRQLAQDRVALGEQLARACLLLVLEADLGAVQEAEQAVVQGQQELARRGRRHANLAVALGG